MAIYNEDIAKVDLASGHIFRSFAGKTIGEGDQNGNRFGVQVYRNNEYESLSGGACIGYFIRPDGITLVINGTVSGNSAYVELPEAAYAKEGQFSLAIKVSGTGFTETLRIVDGTVLNTTTGTINDPSSQIPSLDDLMDVIDRAENAAEDIDALSMEATQIIGTRYKIAVTITT